MTYSGMLLTADITGDARYRKYTQERLAGIATLATHAKKHLAADGSGAHRGPRHEHAIDHQATLAG